MFRLAHFVFHPANVGGEGQEVVFFYLARFSDQEPLLLICVKALARMFPPLVADTYIPVGTMVSYLPGSSLDIVSPPYS